MLFFLLAMSVPLLSDVLLFFLLAMQVYLRLRSLAHARFEHISYTYRQWDEKNQISSLRTCLHACVFVCVRECACVRAFMCVCMRVCECERVCFYVSADVSAGVHACVWGACFYVRVRECGCE